MRFVKTLILASVFLSMGVQAHGMNPGLTKVTTYKDISKMTYEVYNSYEFPAVYTMQVFTQDLTPAPESLYRFLDGKSVVRLKPNSKAKVDVLFKPEQDVSRFIVCSVLTGVSYEEVKPSITSRVCSRLIIERIGR